MASICFQDFGGKDAFLARATPLGLDLGVIVNLEGSGM